MSRSEGLPIEEVTHVYEVQPFHEAIKPCSEPYSFFIHGLWLEGADWNRDKKIIHETVSTDRFVQFPCIKLKSVAKRTVPREAPAST